MVLKAYFQGMTCKCNQDSFNELIQQFESETKTLLSKLEKTLIKLYLQTI